MKQKDISFTWNGSVYVCKNLVLGPIYYRQWFVAGEGWKKEPCSAEEFTEMAKKYSEVMG